MTYDHIFFAGQGKAKARGNGTGGILKTGFYFRHEAKTLHGPFGSENQASLAQSIVNTRRLHEGDLYSHELAALRALRRKGVIAHDGLRLTSEYRAYLLLLNDVRGHWK